MKNIDSAFRYVRLFTIIIVIGSLLLDGVVFFKSYQLSASSQSKIYVLASGKAIEAFGSVRKDNLGVEARDHIKRFHEYFFTLAPDDDQIRMGIQKALYMADGSARNIYSSLQENNYYAQLISGNVSQEVMIDSVQLNLNAYPYYFRLYGSEKIVRPVSTTYRSLVTEGYLREVPRSDNNPHGLLIEKWSILENKDLKTVAR
ncbi:conjugative transposon protein TraK [Arachidicoccus terrestris]|uniref:conjugative transposon protein TraK n=1 Tax=Arachidicoccus terrestris TaxID=2875539 RepID=UPI001CC3CA55|nr:conjugative transposon protein TraK [Arachidicoccus terrestris]